MKVAIARELHFFFDFDLPLAGAGVALEAVDKTLESRDEGAADVALLPAADLTLSRALFWEVVSGLFIHL